MPGLQAGNDLEGENLNVYFDGAGFDFAAVNTIVESALDKNPDVLVTVSVPVAQVAAAATMEMDNPPAILFTMVNAPFEAGIAESSCIKPDHITGGELALDYGFVLSTLQLQESVAEPRRRHLRHDNGIGPTCRYAVESGCRRVGH